MRKIPLRPLSQGRFVIVNSEDYDFLMQWKWHYDCGYAVRTSWKKPKVYMHREILRPTSKCSIDHINGNKLDNRRCNIRIATQSQNNMNAKHRKNTSSRYKGVSWLDANQCWRARLMLNKKEIHIGCFDSEHDAATAYNMAALRCFRQFAFLNEIPYAQ